MDNKKHSYLSKKDDHLDIGVILITQYVIYESGAGVPANVIFILWINLDMKEHCF